MALRVTRREAMKRISGIAAAIGVSAGRAGAEEKNPALAAAQVAPGHCQLFPEAVEGPYYFDPKFLRRDITEGRAGLPLELAFRVIEQGPCTGIGNARVDIWHADAGGVYSGYAGQGDGRDVSTKGETFLRGTQMTDADGRVSFRSIYPGWYPGRTPHIHIKIFLSEREVLTAQLYFPDDVTAKLYAANAPYSARPVPDTTNPTDWIFKTGGGEGGGAVARIAEAQALVTASLEISVSRSASSSGGVIDRLRSWFGK